MDLNALTIFHAVAEAGSFSAAADRLGVTRSAVSQTMRKLEETLGVALVRRTTRSVSLTEEGARLHAALAPALAEIGAAVEAAGDLRERPRGLLRLAVSSIAEDFLSGPLLADFAEANPDVRLDIVVTDEEFDIVAAGFDAGVRLGDVIEADMIAVPVSGDQREMAACAPSYLARHGAPAHPRDLVARRCVGWRPPDAAPWRWEFTVDGRDVEIAIQPEIMTNDLRLMIRLACAGAGVTLAPADCLRPWVDRGELVPVLTEFCPPYPGFRLYFPSRRNLAPKLRALVEHVRAHRRATTGGAIGGEFED